MTTYRTEVPLAIVAKRAMGAMTTSATFRSLFRIPIIFVIRGLSRQGFYFVQNQHDELCTYIDGIGNDTNKPNPFRDCSACLFPALPKKTPSASVRTIELLVVSNCVMRKKEQDPALKRNYETAFELD